MTTRYGRTTADNTEDEREVPSHLRADRVEGKKKEIQTAGLTRE